MQDDGEVPLEDMIGMEQVAKELGSAPGWHGNGVEGAVRARKAGVAQPRTDGGHDLAQESWSAIAPQTLDAAQRQDVRPVAGRRCEVFHLSASQPAWLPVLRRIAPFPLRPAS